MLAYQQLVFHARKSNYLVFKLVEIYRLFYHFSLIVSDLPASHVSHFALFFQWKNNTAVVESLYHRRNLLKVQITFF